MLKFDYFKMKRQESRLEFQVYKCVIVKTQDDRSQCAIMRLLKKKKKKKCGGHAVIINHVTLFVCCPNM